MTDRPTRPAEPRNRLLSRLPEAELRRLRPSLSFLELSYEQVLYEADGPIEFVYFPIDSVLSALTVMQDGNMIEVATVGAEGLVGHYGSDSKTSPHRVVAQIGGGSFRMDAGTLADEVAQTGPLRELLAAYRIAFMAQVSQSVACNGLHRLEQRCCRWLLMSRDRCGTDDLRLTHDYLALMLGARRASVTEVLRPLQEAGLVRSSRGQIRILDGVGLEERSCECYQVVRERYDRLLGTS